MEHHKRYEYCSTRLRYRQGRQLKAVKVYTCANESQHLLIFGVPKINLLQELKRTLVRFGPLKGVKCVTNELSEKVELEAFTDVFQTQFQRIEHARRAKRFLDAQQFYGGILHISYAPEYESQEDLRSKLQKRKEEVYQRIRVNIRNEEKTKVES